MIDRTALPMQSWRVICANGATGWWGLTPWSDETWTIESLPPAPNWCGDVVERRFRSPHVAVCALMVHQRESIVEIVAPGALSAAERELAMQARCATVLDNLWEKVRIMGEADGGDMVFHAGDGGTDTQRWTSDQCDDALDGIHLAKSAVELIDAETDDD